MRGILEEIAATAKTFDSISLSEMDEVKLLDRMDSKFLLSSQELPALFVELKSNYRCLAINERYGSDYRTLYYDTAELESYMEHHNGHTFRQKVRMREYVGSDLNFLEVKRKTGRGGTDKVRIRIPEIVEELNPEYAQFVRESTKREQSLVAVLWNSFTRYTLVHRSNPERLTIDVDLRFKRNETNFEVENLCICELKQTRVEAHSTFYLAMRKRGIRPAGMSKYCMGLIKSDPNLKKNNFKPTLLQIERIQKNAK